MTDSEKVDTVAVEQLTDEDRERADLIANNPHLGRADRLLVSKLVRIHDRLQARVDGLQVERNLAVSALWRVAGTPAGPVDLTVIEKAEARVGELERECTNLVIIIKQSRAEGFGVIRGEDVDPPDPAQS